MKKILISWCAPLNDFIIEKGSRKVNKKGPNYAFHKHFYEQDKHILLSSSEGDDNATAFLLNELRRDFPKHQIEERYMGIKDVIDLQEIRSKVEPLLLEYRDAKIDIFFSPGTAVMRLVWFIFHQRLGLQTRLIQTRKSEDSKSKKPEKMLIEIEKDSTPGSLIIRQKSNIKSSYDIDDYCYTESTKAVYNQALKIAQTDQVGALILGESGSGKEHLARYIHEHSARNKEAFIPVNCSAFGDSLLESRLFGHKRGTFTGAVADHKGYFEQAHRGTLFLDEIGDISPYMQQTLLRALEHKEISPLGGERKRVDVRIIAATNKNLPLLCKEGKFRWDLYYRLAIIDLELPNLRERNEKERKLLINFMLKKLRRTFQRKQPLKIDKEAMRYLLSYPFPGNVRELENLIGRFYVLCESTVHTEQLPLHIRKPNSDFSIRLDDVEKRHIEQMLQRNEFNKAKTARQLDIALNTLKRKIEKYQILEA